MEIISIIRKSIGSEIPTEFTVGIDEVKQIQFFETGYSSGKAFRGKCYVVSFEGSTTKRVIPAREVVDIAVETSKPTPSAKPTTNVELPK